MLFKGNFYFSNLPSLVFLKIHFSLNSADLLLKKKFILKLKVFNTQFEQITLDKTASAYQLQLIKKKQLSDNIFKN